MLPNQVFSSGRVVTSLHFTKFFPASDYQSFPDSSGFFLGLGEGCQRRQERHLTLGAEPVRDESASGCERARASYQDVPNSEDWEIYRACRAYRSQQDHDGIVLRSASGRGITLLFFAVFRRLETFSILLSRSRCSTLLSHVHVARAGSKESKEFFTTLNQFWLGSAKLPAGAGSAPRDCAGRAKSTATAAYETQVGSRFRGLTQPAFHVALTPSRYHSRP